VERLEKELARNKAALEVMGKASARGRGEQIAK
jgi:hypothetical protein